MVENFGIEGDLNAGDGKQSVSLISAESSARREPDGLCSGRFYANIEVEGLLKVSAGERLRIGEAVLTIERIGKKCYPECAVLGRTGPCPLARDSVFARVEKGGRVLVGDSVGEADADDALKE